jgi:hypothetical protein
LPRRAEQPARIPDHGPKIGIFQSKTLHRNPIQNRRKQLKVSISRKVQGFLKNFRVQQEALDNRLASKTHLFCVYHVVTKYSYFMEKKIKTGLQVF